MSRDEDHVEVSVALPRGAHVLPPRAHHYTLLTLARARPRDQGAPSLAEPQRGWRFVDELCRSLAMEESRLNVEIYRIRQDFAALGLHDGDGRGRAPPRQPPGAPRHGAGGDRRDGLSAPAPAPRAPRRAISAGAGPASR
ncbi:hypothetical protein [Sorangium sp. So ce1389]|uniref:hypothetical protein n=1 Tax=Sorangium sp. So ce1389 TaxID=3133336 RepID=UPI003F6004AA